MRLGDEAGCEVRARRLETGGLGQTTSRPRRREGHEATNIPFRDGCAHCMMGRFRTHHHTTNNRCDDHSRRPTAAMNYFVTKQNSAAGIQSISNESVKWIAVKEDRRQHIMGSAVLEKCVQEFLGNWKSREGASTRSDTVKPR